MDHSFVAPIAVPFVSAARRRLRRSPVRPGYALPALLLIAVQIAWIVVEPGGPALMRWADNVCQFLGPLLAAPWCLGRVPDTTTDAARRRWAAGAMGLGLLSWSVGQILWTLYEQVLHQPPSPSWADAGFLGVYPFLLAAILLLPGQRAPFLTRARITLDGLLILTGVATCSWYFLIGPTALAGGTSLFATLVSSAYPCGDLLLLFCLLLLSARRDGRLAPPVVALLAVALSIIIATDTLYTYQTLHGIYRTGTLLDVGWPLGYLLVGMAGAALRMGDAAPAARVAAAPPVLLSPLPPFWRALLPYALVPAVTALVAYTLSNTNSADNTLEPGVLVGGIALIVLIVARQILAIVENRNLYRGATLLNAALRATEDELSVVYDAMACGVIVWDGAGRLVRGNPAAEQILGVQFSALRGSDVAPWRVSGADGMLLADDARPLLVALRTGVAQRNCMLRLTQPGGAERWLQADAIPILDEHGAVRQVVATFLDITDRMAAEALLGHQATHDSLTDLPNRLLLRERLGDLLAARRTGERVGLLLLDLDRFKEVNDTLGHHAGDLLLRQIGVRLREAAGGAHLIARLGGDEFAVILQGAGPDEAEALARSLLAVVAQPIDMEGSAVSVDGSIGVALAPRDGEDAETLQRHADVAMYAAKRAQLGVAFYDAAQDPNSPRRLALQRDLREAISGEQLLLHFQPKVAASGVPAGVEALLRWLHPRYGSIPPDDFIPLAEQSGEIEALTTWVLETALRQYGAWRAAGLALPVAVNVSARSLQDRRLPDSIDRLLRRYGAPPADLTLEITESSLMADPERALEVLAGLRRTGVRLAVDDFGTGYSSLGYLKDLPVHEVKVDRAFVKGMTASAKDAAIVRSVIAMAHALDLEVVAEGVEDRASWEALLDLGCDTLQGYYISRPVSTDDIALWYGRWDSRGGGQPPATVPRGIRTLQAG